jgi:hypothetical protein
MNKSDLIPSDEQERKEYAAKMSLIGIFLAIFVAFASRRPFTRKYQSELKLGPFDIALLGVSTFRLGRLAAFDTVAEPIRRPFTRTVRDESGAGETVEPRGTGIQRAIGELISCPICAGTWIAAALVYGLHLLPGPTRVFMTIMGSIGFAEMLNALTEALSWISQAARRLAGNHH